MPLGRLTGTDQVARTPASRRAQESRLPGQQSFELQRVLLGLEQNEPALELQCDPAVTAAMADGEDAAVLHDYAWTILEGIIPAAGGHQRASRAAGPRNTGRQRDAGWRGAAPGSSPPATPPTSARKQRPSEPQHRGTGRLDSLEEMIRQSERVMKEMNSTLIMTDAEANASGLTRRALPTARQPGPGSYDPSLDLVRPRAPAARIIGPKDPAAAAAAKVRETPGPGSYHPESFVHKRTPGGLIMKESVVVPPSRKRELEATGAAELGPGKYAPVFSSVDPSIRGGAMGRKPAAEVQKKWEKVGPGR